MDSCLRILSRPKCFAIFGVSENLIWNFARRVIVEGNPSFFVCILHCLAQKNAGLQHELIGKTVVTLLQNTNSWSLTSKVCKKNKCEDLQNASEKLFWKLLPLCCQNGMTHASQSSVYRRRIFHINIRCKTKKQCGTKH